MWCLEWGRKFSSTSQCNPCSSTSFPPCSSVAGKYCTLVRKHRKLLTCTLAFSYCFTGICCSAVQTQQCKLPQLTQFTQFGTDKTLLESRNGTLDTSISTFSPLGNCIHFCSSAAFYQSLQRAWKLFNKFLFFICFKPTVGAVSVSLEHATCSEGAAWVTFLCGTLFHSFAVSNFTSSFNIFLFLWLKQGVMTLWQRDKKKKARFEVEMWGSCQERKSQGSLWGMSLCLCVYSPLCVWKVWKFGVYSVSDR